MRLFLIRLLQVCWWAGEGSSTNKLKEGSQWSLPVPVLISEIRSPNDCYQHLLPQGESQLPPPSFSGSPWSRSGSDSGAFESIASTVGVGACEILHRPSKWRFFVSYNTLALLNISPACSQSQSFWGSFSWFRSPGWGDLCGALTLHSLAGGPLWFWHPSHLWVTDWGMWVLTRSYLWPSNSFHYSPFFKSLVVKKIFSASQVILIDSCPVNSCNFDVVMWVGELRNIILCHLGHSLPVPTILKRQHNLAIQTW